MQDDDWADSGDVTKESEFEFLSQLIGPKGMAFDNDDILDDSDDEDLKGDPVSQMDMQVCQCSCLNTVELTHSIFSPSILLTILSNISLHSSENPPVVTPISFPVSLISCLRKKCWLYVGL